MGEHVFDADLSVSVPMLDSLMEPKGVIREAQALAAKAFGATPHVLRDQRHLDREQGHLPDPARSGREAAARPQLPQERAPRRGAVGRNPVYLDSALNRKYGLYGPSRRGRSSKPSRASGRAGADPHLVHVRRPALRPRADRRGGPREGHQGDRRRSLVRLRALSPAFRPTALESRRRLRDAVDAQGAVGVLAGVDDPHQRSRFSEHLFRENFNMHTSTSPQYGLIASLDIARKQAVMEGYKLLSRTLELASELRKQINATGVFRVLELEDLLPHELETTASASTRRRSPSTSRAAATPSKSCSGAASSATTSRSRRSTFNTLSLLLTIGTTRSKVSRLYDALMRIAREGRASRRLVRTPGDPGLHEAALPAARRVLLRRRARSGV
jgi:arginine decarboxylase